jgi:choline dehydrogenase-like flavoprotein
VFSWAAVDAAFGLTFEIIQFVPHKTSNSSVATNVKACREIIMAAGAHNTPQILQLSGIGPKQLLSSLGIETMVDLPGVGRNFQDQPTLYMQYSCKECLFVHAARRG